MGLFKDIPTSVKKLKKRCNFFEEKATALISVLGITVVVMSLGAAVTAAVTGNLGSSTRDRNSKQAVAAAAAGVQEARRGLNLLQPNNSQPCIAVTAEIISLTAVTEESGWCSVQNVNLGNGVSATYQLSPIAYESGEAKRTIVATGTAAGVTRRVKTEVGANTGAPLFGPYALASDKTLTLGGNASINGSARSNENINLSGNASICSSETGGAVPGPGHSVNLTGNADVCGSTEPAASPFTPTAVDQGDAATNNDNDRFFDQDPKVGSVSWNPDTRQLSLSGNSSLTLSGHTYSFCSLNMSGNSQLTVAADEIVRIYIDSTENCGLAPSTTQLSGSGNSKLINTSQLPSHLQIYMLGGDDNTPSKASFSGNSISAQMSFYAPNTELTISGNGSYSGALVAGQITISGNGASVAYDSQVETITSTTIGVYDSNQFVECRTIAEPSTPDEGC